MEIGSISVRQLPHFSVFKYDDKYRWLVTSDMGGIRGWWPPSSGGIWRKPIVARYSSIFVSWHLMRSGCVFRFVVIDDNLMISSDDECGNSSRRRLERPGNQAISLRVWQAVESAPRLESLGMKELNYARLTIWQSETLRRLGDRRFGDSWAAASTACVYTCGETWGHSSRVSFWK